MSIPPTSRELLRLSVEQNPKAWQTGIKDLDNKIKNAQDALGLMRGGCQTVDYSFARKDFITNAFRFDSPTFEEEQKSLPIT